MIEKMPDFYQKREDYRKELREILPVEKQLEYPAEKPEKKLGVPTKELLKLRSSQEPEDRFFIESLRAGIREKLGKDISQEIVQLESLKQFKEEKLCNIAESVDNYASAKEAMERCFKKGWLDSAGKIAIALKDYASAKKAMERCFNEERPRPDSAGKIAVALAGQINFNQISHFQNIFVKHQISLQESIFAYIRLARLLREKSDLGKIILEDIPAFRAIKEYSLQMNQLLSEDKQTKDVEEFWTKNQIRLAKFFNINSELSQNLVNVKLNQFGFSRLEKTLELADGLSLDSEVKIKSLIEKTENANTGYFEKLLELSDAYSRMNLQSSFSQQVENLLSKNNLKPEEAIIVLGKELLFQFSRKLGIKAEISDETFFQWNLEYLSKLFFAEKHFEEESREALKLITKTTLQGDFEKIMLGQSFDSSRYSEEELETIKEIQEHNQKVKNEFEKAGLDYQFWLKDKTSKDFFVGASEKEKIQRLESFKRELSEVVLNILGSYREKKPGILSQERAKILFNSVFKKYGLKFENGEITHSKGKISPLDLQPILQETIDFLKSEFVTTKDERLGTNLDHLNNLLKILPDLQKESKQKSYHFQIKPWDRQPGYDIFQGNYTHCCIAVENFNRAAILDYLTDAGMNIIEIKDQNTGQTVAQTFVFMAQNEEGENIMVLDNVEINNDYRGLNQAIRQHLFEYISEYADKLVKDSRKKINTVLLGTAYNDIETSDLYQRKETVKKVGGAGIADTQYLDSFGSAWVDPSRLTNRTFYVALDDLREKIVEKPEIKKEQKIQIEILNRLNSEILRQIVSVEQASFPEQMQSDENDLRQTLENSKGVQIILRGANREIVGYLSSMPQKDAFEELKEYDKEMRPEDKALYVESIAIKPAARDVRSFLRLGKAFFQEAKRRGFKKITMHARIAENLSAVLQKRYGAKALRKIGNWHGFNEPFDYLEIEVE